MMPIISNYQEGTRNAKVYKDANGRFAVVVYDADDDYNGYESYTNIDEAEDFAEDWVLRAGR
jgi:outer membrane receptor for ferric coprogen and ferric-rhodotorulic acid